MLSNLNAKQTGLVLVLVPIAIELIFVAIISRELIDAGKEFQKLHHVKTTLADLHKMQDSCIQTSMSFPTRTNSATRSGA